MTESGGREDGDRRRFERELLYGEARETVAALLASQGVSQRDLAQRLGLSESRVSRLLNERENTTLKTLADLGWALGIRFEVVALPFDTREGTPAAADPPAPRWLQRQRRLAAGRKEAAGPVRRSA